MSKGPTDSEHIAADGFTQGHPLALRYLFFTEMWERFSYYGMRALLVLYMVQALSFSEAQAASLYGFYTGFVYLTPILGGYCADRFLGQQRAVWLGGILMAIGHFLMALPAGWFFYPALSFLVLGNGFFKPNISVMVGQLYGADDARRSNAFALFYVGINLGAFLAPLLCGFLGQRYGWHYGFVTAGIGMLAGLFIFWRGQRHYVASTPPVATQAPAAARQLASVERDHLIALMILGLLGNIVFFALFEQAGSSLTLFAETATELYLPSLDFKVPSTWLQAINPLFIFILSPLFVLLWRKLAQAQIEPQIAVKFSMGLLFGSIAFCILMIGGRLYDQQGPVSMGYLWAAYFALTCGELCVSPVGLATVTQLAPARLSSLIMGMWFGSLALANILGGQLGKLYAVLSKEMYFTLLAFLAILPALLLIAGRSWIQRRIHVTFDA